MKKILLLSLSGFFSIALLQAQCFINPNNVLAYTIGTKSYGVVKEAKTWSAARACAVQFNGRLAVVESQLEQDSIFAFLNRSAITNSNTTAPDGGGAAYVWLGGNDRTTEGTWVWDSYVGGTGQFWQGARTGSAVGGLYNNWGNEPDNFQNQDAVGIALSAWPFGIAGQWNDVDESNALYFVVEYSGTVGLEEMIPQVNLTLSPNPVQSILRVNCTTCQLKNEAILIYTVEGKLVYEGSFSNSGINVEDLKTGVYFLKIDSIDGAYQFQKN